MDRIPAIDRYLREDDRDPFDDYGQTPDEPEYIHGRFRSLRVIDPQEIPNPERISLDEARERIRRAIADYLAEDSPAYALLIKALPGVGKTTAAVYAAEQVIQEGRRVMYCGPRHEFFDDIVRIIDDQRTIFHWLACQVGDEEKGQPQTCPYAVERGLWCHKGYPGIEFCKRICGWDTINRSCVYHGQKKTQAPIVYCQHQHFTLGHPLQFNVVIGDEDPIQSFCQEWNIPADAIELDNIDTTEPIAHLLHDLATFAREGMAMHGPALLSALGGAEHVLDVCQNAVLPAGALMYIPPIHEASDVNRVPYAHLQPLVKALIREAQAGAEGREYIRRVLVDGGNLTLLQRRSVNDRMPHHVVWLDATANPRLYETCLQRPVRVVDAQPRTKARIYQVVDRANGKGSLTAQTKTERAQSDGRGTTETRHGRQLALLVDSIVERYGYKSPAIAGFKDVIARSPALRKYPSVSYYAGRGTNALEGHDALFVLGTPQPPLAKMEYDSRMIYIERMAPFTTLWTTKDVPYAYIAGDGKGRAYPVSGFWDDPDLGAVLWSRREGEIIQMAHRVRPVNNPCAIWLLSNVPVAELPPDELLTVAEVVGAPEQVNPYFWASLQEYIRTTDIVTSSDLIEHMGIERHAAVKYIKMLVETGEWELAAVRTGRRGRPQTAIKRMNNGTLQR